MATPPDRAHPVSARTGLPLIPRGQARRTARCDGPAPAGLLAGIALFNRGAYWECHEILEDQWRHEPDPVRYFYQGILLVGVGLYHLRRHNRHGALVKLRAGLALLAPYAPRCMGIDVDPLRHEVGDLLTAVERNDPEAGYPPPVISLDPPA